MMLTCGSVAYMDDVSTCGSVAYNGRCRLVAQWRTWMMLTCGSVAYMDDVDLGEAWWEGVWDTNNPLGLIIASFGERLERDV